MIDAVDAVEMVLIISMTPMMMLKICHNQTIYPPNTTLPDPAYVPVMTSHALIAANTLAVQEPEDAHGEGLLK
jgi:hypothetical protein